MTDESTPFPFVFESRTPTSEQGPDLEPYVESIWYARGTVPYTREKIAPTGASVAVLVLGDPIRHTASDGQGSSIVADRGFLIGPHEGPSVNEPLGQTFAVGIVTTPTGCETLFGVPPATVAGTVVDLLDAWAPAAQLRRALLAAPSEPSGLLEATEAHLSANLRSPVTGLERAELAVQLLESNPQRPVADIARELGISHGHLDAELRRVVGLTPRSLARLLRLRRLLARLDVSLDPPWAELAHELGWSDQSHFIRDFKRHTGVTPSGYVAAQRSIYSPVERGDAVGFVPES